MSEYIDREALRDALYTSDAITMEGIKLLNQFPVADVAPIVPAHWKYYKKQNIAVCTNCSFERDLDLNFGRAVSCSNCGAKMDRSSNEE